VGAGSPVGVGTGIGFAASKSGSCSNVSVLRPISAS
jgi:hypothetical protein